VPSFRQEQTGAPRSAGIDAGAPGRFIFDDAAHPDAFVINSDGTIEFKGANPEDIAFSAVGGMEVTAGTSAILTTNNFPRREMGAAVTTSLGVSGFNFPRWWEACDVHIGWVNEGADVVGTVLLAWNLKEVNVGETLAAGTIISTGLTGVAPPPANALTATILDPEVDLTPLAGLGYVLGFEIARIGPDSIANSVSLAAVGFTRLTP